MSYYLVKELPQIDGVESRIPNPESRIPTMIRPLAWATLAFLALVLSWTTGASVFAWAGYTMFALLILGYLTMRLSAGRLVARRELTRDRIYPGESVRVRVRVENHSPFPALWLVAAESLPVGLPVSGVRGRVTPWVGPAGFSFTYTLEGARRGYHELGPTVLQVGDPFGLFQRRLSAGGASGLTVFPKVVALQQPRLSSPRLSGEVRVRRRVLEDPTVIVGIRPYQSGDGLRRVHWRATAHTGRLQSKLFGVTALHDVTLLLDLSRGDYSPSPEEAGARPNWPSARRPRWPNTCLARASGSACSPSDAIPATGEATWS